MMIAEESSRAHALGFPVLIERLCAHFQPIVDLTSGEILGAEALARFVDAEGTVSGPGDLIARIEEDLGDLEEFTWRVFCSIAQSAGPLLRRRRDFYISVNVPPLVLASPRMKGILEDSGLVRYIDRLVCEITERQALTDAGREALAIVRPLGLRIAMDDFGTGESGLNQLIGLPLDILKLDKSTVDTLTNDPTADCVLRGVVALAAAMRVKLIAEGVETTQQAFSLRAAGVHAAQGWLWSKAIPADALERLMTSGFNDRQRPTVDSLSASSLHKALH